MDDIDMAADIVDAALMRGLRAAIPVMFRTMSVSQKAEIREALAYLFDLKVYEDQAKRCAVMISKLHDELARLRYEQAELRKQIESGTTAQEQLEVKRPTLFKGSP